MRELGDLVGINARALGLLHLRHDHDHGVVATRALADQRIVIGPDDLVIVHFEYVLDHTGRRRAAGANALVAGELNNVLVFHGTERPLRTNDHKPPPDTELVCPGFESTDLRYQEKRHLTIVVSHHGRVAR